jgi:hypothetical protein
LKNEYVLSQTNVHSSYSKEEFLAMEEARNSASANAAELQDQLKLAEKKLSNQEQELNKKNEILDTERKKHEQNQLKLEQQLSALLCEKAELEKSKVDLEEKVSR